MSYRLFNGDCLELMKRIPDKFIDLILCDLPYGTTRNKWDEIIPFSALWEQYKRVCKGAVVLTAVQPFTSALVMSNVTDFKYDWTWRKEKGTGHLNAKKQPLRDKEDVLVFYETQPTYNPQFVAGRPYTAVEKGKYRADKVHAASTYDSFNKGEGADNSGFRYPKQVLDFQTVGVGGVHPTQKPVPLMEYLIRTYTNEGDKVLDNCMGSGTTGVACANTNRHFIGMEMNSEYFAIAKNRIEAANNIKESV